MDLNDESLDAQDGRISTACNTLKTELESGELRPYTGYAPIIRVGILAVQKAIDAWQIEPSEFLASFGDLSDAAKAEIILQLIGGHTYEETSPKNLIAEIAESLGLDHAATLLGIAAGVYGKTL